MRTVPPCRSREAFRPVRVRRASIVALGTIASRSCSIVRRVGPAFVFGLAVVILGPGFPGAGEAEGAKVPRTVLFEKFGYAE